ncbi:MAG: hypothetical protein U0R64_06895 [Candidatus Nanopelagicales bacterium]
MTLTPATAMTRTAAVAGAALMLSIGATAAHAGDNGPLVYSAIDPGSHTVQVFRIGAGGGGLRQLSQADSQGQWNECPSVSPSGQAVYYDTLDRNQPGPSAIWKMTIDGDNAKAVSHTNKSVACPSVSPDGKMIAYLQYSKKSQYAQIGVMKKNGTEAKTLLAKDNVSYYSPQYSPDGTMLSVIKVTYTSQGMDKSSDVITVDLATGKQKNLTKNLNGMFDGNGWDPNGKGLVTVRDDRKLLRIFTNGSQPGKLVRVQSGESIASPVYAPTRSRIAYLVCDGDCGDPMLPGEGSIWTVKKNGTSAKNVFTGSPSTNVPADALFWAAKAK